MADSEPFEPSFSMEVTTYWRQFTARANDSLSPHEADALDLLRLQPQRWRRTSWAASGRRQAIERTGTEDGVGFPESLDAFRRERGLLRRDDLARWLEENGLSTGELVRLLRDEASVGNDPLLEPPRSLIDYLQMTGEWPKLLHDARDLSKVADPPSPASISIALDWFIDTRLAGVRPCSIETFAARQGWRNLAHFHNSVWQAYVDDHTTKSYATPMIGVDQ